MKALFGRFSLIQKATSQQIEKWSDDLISVLRKTAKDEAKFVEKYVEQVRRLNQEMSPEDLVKRIVSRRSLKAGGLAGRSCGQSPS
jgi:hypothetical protein